MLSRSGVGTCAVLLIALAIAFLAGGARGQAPSFRVIGPGLAVSGSNVYLLDTANAPVGWTKLPATGITLPPVPASALVYYDEQRAITDTGEGWGKVVGVWTDLGPIPSSVPTTQESWGQLKAKYAR